MNVRVGLGFDAHRLAPDRKLFLGGVEIPHSRGLVGHSDGDVLLHAVTDALLGAAGAPDMGSLFPSADERFRGAASRLFVAEARRILEKKGFRIVQVETVIVAEEPPLASHYGDIRNGLAELLGIPAEAVGVKAKTTDGMGFTGRKEGIFAQAVVLVEKQV
ncbi:MAG: 2-C-methyl-D-erythritol 2,4-cyclodiphosphate synthase [Vicinamibacteria bacterium]